MTRKDKPDKQAKAIMKTKPIKQAKATMKAKPGKLAASSSAVSCSRKSHARMSAHECHERPCAQFPHARSCWRAHVRGTRLPSRGQPPRDGRDLPAAREPPPTILRA